MALRDKFKSIFLAEVEEEAEVSEKTPAQQQSAMPASIISPAMPVGGEINQKMVDGLCETLDESNLEGPDYLEIKQASEALKTVLSDTTQRFQAAFASMKANFPKLTKQIVLNSIDTYVNILEQERRQGKAALNEKRQKEIGNREAVIAKNAAEIAELQQETEHLKKQIESIAAKIGAKQADIAATQSQANEAKLSLDKQEKDFDKSVDFVINQLTTDKNLLNNIL